eukprot:10666466-Alexandrium_andersonii.AAC.1
MEPELPDAASEDPYQPQPLPPDSAVPPTAPEAPEPQEEPEVVDEGGHGEAAGGEEEVEPVSADAYG